MCFGGVRVCLSKFQFDSYTLREFQAVFLFEFSSRIVLLFIDAVSFIFLSILNRSFKKHALLSEGRNIGAVDSGPSLNRGG